MERTHDDGAAEQAIGKRTRLMRAKRLCRVHIAVAGVEHGDVTARHLKLSALARRDGSKQAKMELGWMLGIRCSVFGVRYLVFGDADIIGKRVGGREIQPRHWCL